VKQQGFLRLEYPFALALSFRLKIRQLLSAASAHSAGCRMKVYILNHSCFHAGAHLRVGNADPQISQRLLAVSQPRSGKAGQESL
jgi:hypothetical protein